MKPSDVWNRIGAKIVDGYGFTLEDARLLEWAFIDLRPDPENRLPAEPIQSDDNFLRSLHIEPCGKLVDYVREQHGFAIRFVLKSVVADEGDEKENHDG